MTQSSAENKTPGIPEDWREWQKYGHSLVRESLKTQDETAKYVIGLVSTVVTLYTTVLTYLGLSGQANLTIYVAIPLGIMIVSLGITLLVFKPETEEINFDDPVGIMRTVVHRSIHKYNFLSAGILIFIIGIFAIPFVIGIGITPAPQEVRLIVTENNKLLIENVSITFEPNSLRTAPYTLLQQDQKTYTILLSDGSKAIINKDWIQAIIYTKKSNVINSVCYSSSPVSEVFFYEISQSDYRKNSILKMPEVKIFPNRTDLGF